MKYDRYAPSKQNLLCNGKSVLEVLSESVSMKKMDNDKLHFDVRNLENLNSPNPNHVTEGLSTMNSFRKPIFHYITKPAISVSTSLYIAEKSKYEQPKIVLVLDISQEMNAGDRWMKNRDALFRFIVQLLPIWT